MTSRRILFVNSDPVEIETMREIVRRMDNEVLMCTVHSGREALDALMGTHGVREKPDVILASTLLLDMSAFELFSIVRKYHSMANMRFFLLTDRKGHGNPSLDPLSVDGYLHRPLRADRITIHKLSQLVGDSDKMRLTLFAGLSIPSGFLPAFKAKLIAAKGIFTATKIAVGIASIAVPCVVVVSSFEEDVPKSTLRNSGWTSPRTEEPAVPIEKPATVLIEESDTPPPTLAPVERQFKHENVEVSPDTIVYVEAEIPVDTAYTKTFSIRVRESSGTKLP